MTKILIADETYATDVLKQISYFAFTGGYKELFRNSITWKYKDKNNFSIYTKNVG